MKLFTQMGNLFQLPDCLQGMNIIKAKSEEKGWNIDLGGLARIWKVGYNSSSNPFESQNSPCVVGVGHQGRMLLCCRVSRVS